MRPQAEETLHRDTVRQITLRLMPLFGLMYLIAYIDRQNVSYAKLQMASALSLSEAAYGLGASLFFLGYFLFEAPSNIILAKVGPKVWFARIMASWGLVTVLLGFTQNPTMFYVLRFMLGVAEAGFFPGVLYVLTLWFPARDRGRMVGWFMIASALANAVGSAIGGALLDLDGALGLAGWQWVFLATGVPAIILAPISFLLIPKSPETAPWLSDERKAWLARTLDAENTAAGAVDHSNPLKVLADPRVLLICAMYIGLPLAAYGLSYWLPTIVKSFGVSNTTNGFINVIPWLLVAFALWWNPRHSAKTGEKTWHIVVPCLVGAVCLVASVVAPGPVPQFAFLSVAAACIFMGQPVFWTLPPSFLRGATAAAGIAVVNSFGNLGGFIAQTVVPLIKDMTGSNLAPMIFLAACLVYSAVMVFVVQAALRKRAPAGG
ncbi:MAG: MFS transporter [Caulobacterales bacterium 68-7]|nr:MAG: MFS transporter [Caulobacterales bacterium 68-7]